MNTIYNLFHRIKLGDTEAVKTILAENPEFIEKTEYGRGNITPLIHAVENNCTEVAKCLVEIGANVMVYDGGKRNIVYLAAQRGNASLVETFVKKGAYVNGLADCRETPLIAAAKRGCIETVSLLLDFGASTSHKNEYEETALQVAVKKRHKKCADLIRCAISLRANEGVALINFYANFPGITTDVPYLAKTREQFLASRSDSQIKELFPTAIEKRSWAFYYMFFKIENKLKGSGDTDKLYDEYMGAIDIADTYGKVCFMRYLLPELCKITNSVLNNKLDSHGYIALHYACKRGFTNEAAIILAKQENNTELLFNKNNNGETPFALAIKSKHVATAALIIDTYIKLPRADGQLINWAQVHESYPGLAELATKLEDNKLNAVAMLLFNASPFWKITLAKIAVDNGNGTLLEEIVGAEVNDKAFVDSDLLVYAIESRIKSGSERKKQAQDSMIKLLIQRDVVNVNNLKVFPARSSTKSHLPFRYAKVRVSALLLAAINNMPMAVQNLLAHGANLDIAYQVRSRLTRDTKNISINDFESSHFTGIHDSRLFEKKKINEGVMQIINRQNTHQDIPAAAAVDRPKLRG